MTEQAPTTRQEPPQYKLTERAFIGDQLREIDDTVYYKGIPGPHMIPVNAAAKEMVKKHADRMTLTDPIRDLTIVGPGATVLQATHNQ